MIRPLFAALIAAGVAITAPLSQAAQGADPEVIDGIAATVNGEVITYSQVRAVVGPRARLLHQQYQGEELQKKLKEVHDLALQDLIDRQLIVQSFKKEGLALPDYFVEQRMNDIIRENFGNDRQAFIKTLEAQNVSMSEFRKLEFDKIIVAAMRGKNVKPNSRAVEGNAASQKAMAEEILGKLAGGADFARIAQMYSEDTTRDTGGDWGWVERKTLAPQLEKVAFSLPKGKVSNIIELSGNYYIVKVEDRRGGVTKSLAEVRPEVEKKMMQEETQRLQENWLAGLRQKATIRRF
jgi:parvulin-like peptidyl-prolyl isomerase